MLLPLKHFVFGPELRPKWSVEVSVLAPLLNQRGPYGVDLGSLWSGLT
jgi:hypothetical protein